MDTPERVESARVVGELEAIILGVGGMAAAPALLDAIYAHTQRTVKAEREACAKLCDLKAKSSTVAKALAASIRARPQP